MQWEYNSYVLYDEKDRVDITALHALLRQTYWAGSRSREKVEKLVANSTCFSLYNGKELIAFVRVVSDFASTSWVADMVVKSAYRGEGLGQWMMEQVLAHPELSHTQFALQTKDAHSFYEKLGFAQRPTLMSTAVTYL
ncbi:MAG: GNAT family N-acetyltransferase [Bacteroidota bacterium]